MGVVFDLSIRRLDHVCIRQNKVISSGLKKFLVL